MGNLDLHNAIIAGVANASAHEAALEAATALDLDDANLLSGRKLVRVGSPAASDGSVGWTVTSVTNAPTKALFVNSGGSFDVAHAPAVISAGTPSSSYEQSGMLWFDATLNLWRVYRDITADALISGTGLAGWHPLASGLTLVSNETGSTIEVGRVVALVGTTATRRVTKTTTIAQQNPFGVTLQEILTGATGVCARPGYGPPVQVFLNGAVVAVVAGDIIVPSATAGLGQSVGPSPATAYVSVTSRTCGMPRGAFATALTTSSADALTMCSLLGAVGQGCEVLLATPYGGAFATDSQVGAGSSAWTNRNFSANLLSSKHVPHVALVTAQLAVTTGGGGQPSDASGQFSANQADLSARLRLQGQSDSANVAHATSGVFLVPTVNDSAAPTTIGSAYSSRVTLTLGASVANVHTLMGYRY